MGPIARLLLRSGVSWGEFSELSKEVFVDIARRDYGIQGRPTNTARVAMMTGLSRREVTRVRDVLLGDQTNPPPAPSRISQILTGWHLDPEFCDNAGNPLELSDDGDSPTLVELFKRYAGDFPHRALTKELIQLGLVEKTTDGKYRALKRDYIRQHLDAEMVNQMGIALHDHAATLAHNLNADQEGPARFERIASNHQVSSRYSRAFITLMDERGQEFLEEIDAWLSQHEVKDPSRGSDAGRRMGVGVYVYCEDTRKGPKS